MDLLDRFLANMEVGVGAFTSCDIRLGYQLTFEFCSTASLHYCLAGQGTLKTRNGSTIMLRQHSFVLLPPGVIYSIGANENEESLNFPRRRLRAPLFKESVPTIHAGEGEPGILTACGEVGVAVTSTPDLFASLDKPIVEHFDGREGLRDQFVILLAESSRPGLGTRALTEALLKQCLILLLRRQIDRGTAPIPWMSAMAEPGACKSPTGDARMSFGAVYCGSVGVHRWNEPFRLCRALYPNLRKNSAEPAQVGAPTPRA